MMLHLRSGLVAGVVSLLIACGPILLQDVGLGPVVPEAAQTACKMQAALITAGKAAEANGNSALASQLSAGAQLAGNACLWK